MILKRKFIFQNSYEKNISFGIAETYVIRRIEGIDTNVTDLSTSKSVGQIGETVNNVDIKSKSITLDGFIKTSDLADRYNIIDTIIPGDFGKLFCILETGDIYYLDAIVKKSPTIENTDCNPNLQIELNIPYPFWKKTEKQINVAQGLIPLFKYPRNTGSPSPWKFSKYQEGEYTTITNYGDYKVGMTIILKAKANISGFKLENVKTLEYIGIKPSYNIQKDEVITITTGYNNKKIVSSVNGNIIKNMDLDSVFLQLIPGINTFKAYLNQDKTLMELFIEYDTIRVGI